MKKPADSIVIIAPHPDDESLGCAGVILRAKRSGGRVRVIFLTNGDGFAKAAAALSGKEMGALGPVDFLEVGRVRQQNALDAARMLGLVPGDLVFLGYPDTGLAAMKTATAGDPFTQTCTGMNHTYGLIFPDYHTRRHGIPASYCWEAARDDLAELLRSFQPRDIYVTDAADGHGDHAAAFDLVRDAAVAAAFHGELYTYLIHGRGGTWPWPRGAAPDGAFEAHEENGHQVPVGIAWPPDERRALGPEEIVLKHAAIRAYSLEMQLASHYVESFVKSEEIFWRRNLKH